MSTIGYAGQRISKGAAVFTDDPLNGVFELTMTGMVEPFADIDPERVVLVGRSDAVVEKTVAIKVSAKYPFAILKALARFGSDISFTITGRGEPCCREYLLRVVNTRARPGRYADTIILETDSAVRPTLSVAVMGNIQ